MTIAFTKEISPELFSELQDMLESNGNELQQNLVTLMQKGTDSELFNITTNEDDSIKYTIVPVLQSNVVKDHAKKDLYEAVIYNRHTETYVHFNEDLVENCLALPDLVQAFYKGDLIERNSDYEYHFYDGDTYPAVKSKTTIERLETQLTLTDITKQGGHFPQIWSAKDTENTKYTLRERSGKIVLREDQKTKKILQVFVGEEYPGLPLSEKEVLNIISSIDEITIESN